MCSVYGVMGGRCGQDQRRGQREELRFREPECVGSHGRAEGFGLYLTGKGNKKFFSRGKMRFYLYFRRPNRMLF